MTEYIVNLVLTGSLGLMTFFLGMWIGARKSGQNHAFNPINSMRFPDTITLVHTTIEGEMEIHRQLPHMSTMSPSVDVIIKGISSDIFKGANDV
tara:strand:- start:6296 stop:6577 length:282 start_codon:yes stop_codon:yes gene_type:complete